MSNLSAALGQGSYGGVTWGPGTDFHISQINLDDLPTVRSNDAARPLDPGTFSGFDFPDGRSFQMEISIIAPDSATFHNDLARLQAAFTPIRQGTLPLLIFNSQRLINCRVRRRTVGYDSAWPQRVGVVTLEMFAPDPRVYDANATVATVGLPNPGGGFTFPISFPISFGAAAVGGAVQFTNAGNFPTRPVFVITAPVTNPTIANTTSGQFLLFNITLGLGDTLTVDTDARTILLNGTGGRRNVLDPTSQWFELAPGLSTVTFQAYSYDPAPTLQMTASSAWI